MAFEEGRMTFRRLILPSRIAALERPPVRPASWTRLMKQNHVLGRHKKNIQ